MFYDLRSKSQPDFCNQGQLATRREPAYNRHMSAKDLYHDSVKTALVKDGWEITHDPLRVPWRKTRTLQIDLGARMLLAAVKGEQKIAIEIKSFLGISDLDDLYKAVGQFTVYRIALQKVEPEREIFLAIHEEA